MEKSFKVIKEMSVNFTLLEGDLLYVEIPDTEGKFYKLTGYDWPDVIRIILKPNKE